MPDLPQFPKYLYETQMQIASLGMA